MTKLAVHSDGSCSVVENQIITLPDGYNGHTMDFYLEPISIEGDSVRLQVAEKGKEWMSKLWSKDYITKYLV